MSLPETVNQDRPSHYESKHTRPDKLDLKPMPAAAYRAYSDNFTKQDIQAKACKHKKE